MKGGNPDTKRAMDMINCDADDGHLMIHSTKQYPNEEATSFHVSKGQLISKGLFDVIVSTKNPTNFFLRISTLASKKRSEQKNKGTLYH